MFHVPLGKRGCALAVLSAVSLLAPIQARAQTAAPAGEAPMSEADKAAKRAALLQQLETIQAQLRDLGPATAPTTPATSPSPPAPGQPAPAAGATPAGSAIPQVVVTAPSQPTVQERALGQPIDTATRSEYKDSPAFTAGQIMQNIPDVSVKTGNGPRDTFISIRGSNANNAFGIRNIQMFEDGFPVTQPDGLSRVDDLDPHAIGSVDVYKGPSSALFGNYATGGAILFHTRTGADINGFEFGSDAGSFNYFNEYLTYGGHGSQYDYALFGSHVRGDGYIGHSAFQTTTEDLTGSYAPTNDDKFIVKLINNDLSTDLPIRQSYNQYRLNPFQQNCGGAATAAPGCPTINLFNNGFNGATTAATAQQAGLGRTDRRTIGGMRWEHNIDADTVWRTTFTFDDKDINQPTGTTSARGSEPAFNIISDVTHQGSLFSFPATQMAGLYFNYADLNNLTYNLTPAGNAALGGLTAQTFGHDYNFGARGREEVKLSPQLTAVGGLAVEYTSLDARETLFAYPTAASPTQSLIPAYRQYINTAPEAALLYRPDDEWVLRSRVATGYGTPQASNLFVTPQGVNGNNTSLKPQTNVGFDTGADWAPLRNLTLSVTGFYEFFNNEFVTQSPGAGLQAFTFNAPASVHRGIETSVDWRPIQDWRLHLVYAYDDQYYSKFVEQLSAGAQSTAFSRAHNMIPGVEPNLFLARLAYDRSEGLLTGFGGFLELYYRDGYFIDNANLLKVPSYQVLNFNVHYNPEIAGSYFRGLSLFFEVDNLLNQTYVASANNVSDSISGATGQQNGAATVANSSSIYAGAPRTYIGGMKLKF
jgi:iron complex outermembrane receptor protein